MRRLRTRGVAIVLVPCLLADPLFAFVHTTGLFCRPRPNTALYNQQAVVARLLTARWLGRNPSSPVHRALAAQQRQLLPIPAPLYFEIDPHALKSQEANDYLADIIPRILDPRNNQRFYGLTSNDVNTFLSYKKRFDKPTKIVIHPKIDSLSTHFIIRRSMTETDCLEIFPQTFDREFIELNVRTAKIKARPFRGSFSRALSTLHIRSGHSPLREFAQDIPPLISRVLFCAYIPDPSADFYPPVEETLKTQEDTIEIKAHPIVFEPGYEDLLLAIVVKAFANLRTPNREQAFAAFLVHFTRIVGISRARKTFKLPGIHANPLLELYTLFLREAAPDYSSSHWRDDSDRFPHPDKLPYDALKFSDWLQTHSPDKEDLHFVGREIRNMYAQIEEKFGSGFLFNEAGPRMLLPIPVISDSHSLEKQSKRERFLKVAA